MSPRPSPPQTELPIDGILPDIVHSLRHNPSLVIEAPPGAGKTTRVPPALLEVVTGEVIVLEPRRIAARLAARRVAQELGEPIGETVGYQVRFEEVSGPRTRLRFFTEGVLTRRLLSDPSLKGVDAVVLDEFHERHLDSDLALALLKRLQRTRADLRIVVMSATLEAAPIARYLNDCPILRSEGRLFSLTLHHRPYSPKPLQEQVSDAVETLLNTGHTGDILAFLPGAAEIRRAHRACTAIAQRTGTLVLPLHGDLTPAEQDRAVTPAAQRKLILATNVAETSITVEGVTAVIDSGLARVASYSPWTGLPSLQVSRISKASAKQRAGRAGRTAPGLVLRLYTEQDFLLRPDHDAPEITRSDLSQLALALRLQNLTIAEIDWLDSPPPAAIESAESLLDLLGVARLGATGKMAQRLSRYPLSPRLARIVVEALDRGVGHNGCTAVALLSSGTQTTGNDLLTAIEADHDARTRQLIEQIQRIAHPTGPRHHDPRSSEDDALLISVLTGFPDRVARRRAGNQVLLSNGASAEIVGQPPPYEFMVAVDAEDRTDKPLPLIRLAARIEPEWLIDLYPERIREQSTVEWNRIGERVEGVTALLYGQLIIQESRGAMPDPEAAADLLAQKAIEAGLERFVDREALDALLARIEFAGIEPPDIEQALRDRCNGLRSFDDLKSAAETFIPMLEQKIGTRRLDELVPSRIKLANGRQTSVHYERGKPPWIASRLQDFFGMKETPRIGLARTPVVVHLLAPNQRSVQTTTDLAGFWERLYPQVRRELMRRYPRHQWPEKP